MAVYTYVGNKDSSDHTGKIVLRGGALILAKDEWADLTPTEVGMLSQKFELVPGTSGSAGSSTSSKAQFVLDDIYDVSAALPAVGQTIVWNGTAWAAGNIAGGSSGIIDLKQAGMALNGSDEGALFNSLTANLPPGTTVHADPRSVIGTTIPLIRRGNINYDFGDSARQGDFATGCCTIKALTGFMAPPAVWPAGGVVGVFMEEWLLTGTLSATTGAKPGRVKGLHIDGNRGFINTGRCVDRVGSTTNGSSTVTVATTSATTVSGLTSQAIVTGMPVSGAGIPAGALVDSVSAASFTMKDAGGNPVNATSTATNLLFFGKVVAGVMLTSFWLDIDDIYVQATTGPGVLFTDRAADGTTTIAVANPGLGSEIRMGKIRTSGTDMTAICQRTATSGIAMDGHAEDFYVSNCAGYAAIYFDDATGWQIDKIHFYGCIRNGVVAKNGYAHQLGQVYGENFGQEGIAGQTYREAWCTMNAGRALDYDNIRVYSTEAGASSNYNYVQIDTSSNQSTVDVEVRCQGGYEGAGTSRGTGLFLNPSTGTRLRVSGTVPHFKNIARDIGIGTAGGDVLLTGSLSHINVKKIEPTEYPVAAGTITLTRGQVVGRIIKPTHTQSWSALATATPGTGAVASGATHAYLGVWLLDSAGAATLIARSADDTTLFTVNATYYKRNIAFDGSGNAITSIKLESGRTYLVAPIVVGGSADPVLKGLSWTSSTHAADLSDARQSATGQTDIPAAPAMGTISTNAPWLAVLA